MVLLNMFVFFSKPITLFSKRAIFKVQLKVLEFEPVSGWRRYMASLQCAVAPFKHCLVINFVWLNFYQPFTIQYFYIDIETGHLGHDSMMLRKLHGAKLHCGDSKPEDSAQTALITTIGRVPELNRPREPSVRPARGIRLGIGVITSLKKHYKLASALWLS